MIRVIDIETTGTDPETDAIIEIAAIDLVGDGRHANPCQTLVNPGRPIPPASSAVHHLVDADVFEAPALSPALDLFRGADFYVAHNAKFERSFLEPYGFDARWICTMKCALRVWGGIPDFPGASNQALRYWLGILEPFGITRDQVDPHRALSDVLVTGEIFYALLRYASWDDLQRWSEEPALYSKLTFGRHRGLAVSEAPADYLQWLATGKHELEEDWRFTAQQELDRRAAAVVKERA